MILRVGLTGGIASGKSTVARMLGELGCVIIDADRIVSELYEQDAAGYKAIVHRYGPEVLRSDGEIDRARLAATALGTASGAAELNQLIHPLVIAETERRLSGISEMADDQIVVVEAALLLESGGAERYDHIVVVELTPEEQLRRGVIRGMQREDLERRMSRQMSAVERRAAAGTVIDNSGDLEALRRQVIELHLRLQDLLVSRSR